jgi:hypothetical protein
MIRSISGCCAPGKQITAKVILMAFTCVFLLPACTSEVGRLDAEAKRLCAIDGGIKVYETVVLPAEKFFENGTPMIPNGKDHSGFGYYSAYDYSNLNSSFEPPTLIRHEYRIVRTSDKRVMATSVIYRRSGGGLLDGYMHPSGFSCPADDENTTFYKQVILQGVKK